jgi:hypothetical protein
VGNYALGKLIGKGSFGKVYLATHKLSNGSRVVLKSARKDDSNLAREIHHHRQFTHPHIARLYEVIVTETLVWLALEYCPGARRPPLLASATDAKQATSSTTTSSKRAPSSPPRSSASSPSSSAPSRTSTTSRASTAT